MKTVFKKIFMSITMVLAVVLLVACDNTTEAKFEGVTNTVYVIGEAAPKYLENVKAFDNKGNEVKKEDITVDSSKVNLEKEGIYEIVYSFNASSDKKHEQKATVAVKHKSSVTEATNYITKTNYNNILNKGRVSIFANLGTINTPESNGMKVYLQDSKVSLNMDYDLTNYDEAKLSLALNFKSAMIMDMEMYGVTMTQPMFGIGVVVNVYVEKEKVYIETKIPTYPFKLDESRQPLMDEKGTYLLEEESNGEIPISMVLGSLPKEVKVYEQVIKNLMKSGKEYADINFNKNKFDLVKMGTNLLEGMISSKITGETLYNSDFSYRLDERGLTLELAEYDFASITDLVSNFVTIPNLGKVKNTSITLKNNNNVFEKLTIESTINDYKVQAAIETIESIQAPTNLTEYVKVNDLTISKGISDLIVLISQNKGPVIDINAGYETVTTNIHNHVIGTAIPKATAYNLFDNNIEVKMTGTVDFNTAGTYEVTYTAVDGKGNQESRTITYIVVEK